MKTPITEAIEKIKQSGWLDTQSKMAAVGILTELLPKEKEAIEKAVDETNQKWRSSQVEVILNGRQYFNETFTQK
jgi:hypothetical protein